MDVKNMDIAILNEQKCKVRIHYLKSLFRFI